MDFLPLDLGRRLVDYHEAWDVQRRVHADVVAGRAPDTVIVVEHAPVYTAGRRTSRLERPVDGTPVVDVDRGGRITWHGPGQIVAYPILRLAEPVDVVGYVRALEQVIIDACAGLGCATVRVEGRSGVWLPATAPGGPDRKIAAIGVRVARGVTMHGLALNCDPDLTAFGRIVPCGLPDADVTSLTAELGHPIGVTDVDPVLRASLTAVLTPLTADGVDRQEAPAVADVP